MDEKRERYLRRTAIRLRLQGRRTNAVLQGVRRGRTWLSKWYRRYQHWGWAGLRSQSRVPHYSPHQYPASVRRLIVRVYRHLQQRRVGLSGISAVYDELRQQHRLRPTPSPSTIKRVLRQAGVFKKCAVRADAVYYPWPRATAQYTLHASDWTARYLRGGAKVYAFHTLDLTTRACTQTIHPDKTTASVIAHAKKVWKTQGIPEGLQLDNDSAFNGGYKAPRIFGRFVRLCLYFGIEPIFIPVGEAERNGDVEQVHRLWGKAIWRRQQFTSVRHVQRSTPKFEAWYLDEYRPPKLNGQTPRQAQRTRARHRLTERAWREVPEPLPLTAGRIHFIRQVDAQGDIALLNEIWHVDKRLVGQYVWATLWTHKQQLDIYHRRSAHSAVRQLKTYPYSISEPVHPLKPEFKRQVRRRKMFTML